MNRIICLITALALMVCGLAFGESLTDEMKRLTVSVKEQLGITDDYTSFDVSCYDGVYYLYWSGDGKSVDATASAEGTVYSCWSWDNSGYTASQGGISARFPALDSSELCALADEFVSRVLPQENWGFIRGSVKNRLSSGKNDRCYVSGCLTYMGIPTDITFSVALDVNTGRVTGYSRSDSGVKYASISPAAAQVTLEAADGILRQNDALKLVYYVVDENDMARLVYQRDYNGERFVRADTGEVISAYVSAVVYSNDTLAAEEAKAAGLTEYELEGINVYENALGFDDIEAVIRGISLFGLDEGYTRGECHYYAADGKPYASVCLTDGETEMYFSCDAVTGMPVSMYSWGRGGSDENSDIDITEFETAARELLEICFPEKAECFSLTSSDTGCGVTAGYPTAGFNYTRVHNDYAFESDTANVQIDTANGCVRGFSLGYNETQEFYEVPEPLLEASAALDSMYTGTHMELMYLTTCEDDETSLTLVWRRVSDESVYAIDAETGERYTESSFGTGVYTYESTENMLYAEEIITLGQYGIGFEGRAFDSDDLCSSADLARLVLMAEGFSNPDNPAELFRIRYAVALPEGEAITRADAAKLLACAAGYSNAVKLTGIYTCPVSDWESVPEEYKPGVAICYALGLMSADESGCVNAEAPMLLADAAHAVYVMLSAER